MPSPVSRVLRRACIAALAGSLMLPGVAWAAADEEHQSDQAASHRPTATPSPTPQGDNHRATPGATPSPGKPSDRPTPADPKNRRGTTPTPEPGDAHADDPAGNNGTIKIDYPTGDSGNANRPHPGCGFQLRMFGFDDDQWGALTVTAQAPTDGGTLLTRRLLLSDDAAGGGQDVDETYTFTTTDLGLTGEPTSAQGWHLKVAVDAENAPGGAKQKVLWLDCDPLERVAPDTSNAVRAPVAPNREAARLITAELVQENSVAQPTRITGGGGRFFGASLPFTGAPLVLLLVAAAASLVMGVTAVRAGRRRTGV